jgi:hypothetical protein
MTKTAEELMSDLKKAHPLATGTDNYRWMFWVCKQLALAASFLSALDERVHKIERDLENNFGRRK